MGKIRGHIPQRRLTRSLYFRDSGDLLAIAPAGHRDMFTVERTSDDFKCLSHMTSIDNSALVVQAWCDRGSAMMGLSAEHWVSVVAVSKKGEGELPCKADLLRLELNSRPFRTPPSP